MTGGPWGEGEARGSKPPGFPEKGLPPREGGYHRSQPKGLGGHSREISALESLGGLGGREGPARARPLPSCPASPDTPLISPQRPCDCWDPSRANRTLPFIWADSVAAPKGELSRRRADGCRSSWESGVPHPPPPLPSPAFS